MRLDGGPGNEENMSGWHSTLSWLMSWMGAWMAGVDCLISSDESDILRLQCSSLPLNYESQHERCLSHDLTLDGNAHGPSHHRVCHESTEVADEHEDQLGGRHPPSIRKPSPSTLAPSSSSPSPSHHIKSKTSILRTKVNMHFTNPLLSLAALIPLASAVGNAIVKNHCSTPVYLWSVGGSMGPKQTIQPGSSYSEVLHRDPQSGGIALKITRTDNGLFDGSPQLNFAYNLDGNTLWYDMSDVFGDPFAGSVLKVKPEATCPAICWANGVPPAGSQVKNCGADCDIVLNLCAQGC